ncbi:MAG: MFS transporter [Steroidobacteraceae bacterium]
MSVQRRFPTAAPDGLVAALLLSFLATAGIFYINIMPALVSGLVDGLHFSARDAGLVGSANVYGAAVGALAITFFVTQVAWRPASVAMLLALIAIDALSLTITSPWALIAIRAVHGCVGGMLVGLAYAVFTRTRSPDRVFGVLLLLQFSLGSLGVYTLPRLVPVFGTGALFVTLAGFSIATLCMLPFLAPYPVRTAGPAGTTPQGGSPAHDAAPAPGRRRGLFMLALAALFLFQASNMGLFSYIFELGKEAGLDREFTSSAVATSTIVGASGSLLVIVFATRFGRALPLAVALVVTLAGIWVLHYSQYRALFLIANCATAVTWSLVIPYLLGLASAFDSTGRAAALGGFASKLGLATGPLIGALVQSGGRYGLLINLSCIGIALCAAAALPSARATDRRA